MVKKEMHIFECRIFRKPCHVWDAAKVCNG